MSKKTITVEIELPEGFPEELLKPISTMKDLSEFFAKIYKDALNGKSLYEAIRDKDPDIENQISEMIRKEKGLKDVNRVFDVLKALGIDQEEWELFNNPYFHYGAYLIFNKIGIFGFGKHRPKNKKGPQPKFNNFNIKISLLIDVELLTSEKGKNFSVNQACAILSKKEPYKTLLGFSKNKSQALRKQYYEAMKMFNDLLDNKDDELYTVHKIFTLIEGISSIDDYTNSRMELAKKLFTAF